MSFNLIEKPWIPVIYEDWQRQEISLTNLFKDWKIIREIEADNPPTTLAIYRFLFAILHSAYQGPEDINHWKKIQAGDGQKAIAYLDKWRDRFDLFHSKYPFMQDLHLTKDKSVPIFAIHTMSTSKVFSHEHEFSGYSISLSEAARLLVRLQSVDITSLRAFYPPQSSGNRSAVNTPTINNANVIVCGQNLQMTLLMNLVRYSPKDDEPIAPLGEDLPSWELGYHGKPNSSSIPNCYIAYLTYPWRRINLFKTGDSVDRIAITMGNSLPKDMSFEQLECGLAFREGKPVRISPERQLWRDSYSFLLSSDQESRPKIIEWVAKLAGKNLIDKSINLKVFGMCADKAKPLAWSIENFSVPTIYIQEKELSQRLKEAINIAKEHEKVFAASYFSPYQALGKVLKIEKVEDIRSLASTLNGKSHYWATLDRIFPELLSKLPEDKENIEGIGITYGNQRISEWKTAIQNSARNSFTQSIASISNYEARARALQQLEIILADLRRTPLEREERKARAKQNKQRKTKDTQESIND
jgi:CRISPR system Cascade subunit CasA